MIQSENSDDSFSSESDQPKVEVVKTKKRKYGEFAESQEEFGKFTETPDVEKKRKISKGRAETSKKSFLKERKSQSSAEVELVAASRSNGRPMRNSRVEALQSLKAISKAQKTGNDEDYYKVIAEQEERKQKARAIREQPEDEEAIEEEVVGDTLRKCLAGLTIVVSGTFLGISRDDIEALINKFGGRRTGSISGKTDYLIVGHKLEDGREVS